MTVKLDYGKGPEISSEGLLFDAKNAKHILFIIVKTMFTL